MKICQVNWKPICSLWAPVVSSDVPGTVQFTDDVAETPIPIPGTFLDLLKSPRSSGGTSSLVTQEGAALVSSDVPGTVQFTGDVAETPIPIPGTFLDLLKSPGRSGGTSSLVTQEGAACS